MKIELAHTEVKVIKQPVLKSFLVIIHWNTWSQ